MADQQSVSGVCPKFIFCCMVQGIISVSSNIGRLHYQNTADPLWDFVVKQVSSLISAAMFNILKIVQLPNGKYTLLTIICSTIVKIFYT